MIKNAQITPIYIVIMLPFHRVLITLRLFQHLGLTQHHENIYSLQFTSYDQTMKKIINHYQSIINNEKGFTLVEMLAVITVFIVIGIFIESIIVGVIRGNNKSNAIAAVQTNGTYALTQMSKVIRSARALDSSVSCGTIENPVSANSFAIINYDGQKTTFACTTDNQSRPIIASNSAPLTDATTVKWQSCSFSCGRNSLSDYPVVTIQFTLQSTGNASFADATASSSGVVFQTAVVMRNQER